MRTTLTLEKDVAVTLDRLRRARRSSLKALINEALREGLKRIAAPDAGQGAFETATVDLGRCFADNVDDVAEAIAVAESETFR